MAQTAVREKTAEKRAAPWARLLLVAEMIKLSAYGTLALANAPKLCKAIPAGSTQSPSALAEQPLSVASRDGTIKLWDVQTSECFSTLRIERPYERMNITGILGLNEAQKATLRVLGAIEDES
jgi:WD40 repeat protein